MKAGDVVITPMNMKATILSELDVGIPENPEHLELKYLPGQEMRGLVALRPELLRIA